MSMGTCFLKYIHNRSQISKLVVKIVDRDVKKGRRGHDVHTTLLHRKTDLWLQGARLTRSCSGCWGGGGGNSNGGA